MFITIQCSITVSVCLHITYVLLINNLKYITVGCVHGDSVCITVLPRVGNLLRSVGGPHLLYLLQTGLTRKLKYSLLTSRLTEVHSALVNLIFVSLASPGNQHTGPVRHLVTLYVGEDDLLVDADFHRLWQGDGHRTDHRDQGRLQMTSLVDLLMTVSRSTVGRGRLMVGVQADDLLMADLLPMCFHQLSFRDDRFKLVRVGAYFVIDDVMSLHTNSPHHIMTFLVLMELHTIPSIFLITVSLQSRHTNFRRFLNVVKRAFFTIIGGRSMRLCWSMVGWSMVGRGWCMVGYLGWGMVGRLSWSMVGGGLMVDKWLGFYWWMVGSLVWAGTAMAMGYRGVGTTIPMVGVEVALRAGEGEIEGADTQDKLMMEHGCPL